MSTPKKVAVLGGGVGALVTAFELTKPELKGQYDVTVYQMGWRCGGKGASGRNRKIGNRIEEHGLHIWMGFYDNAFTIMQEAYKEMGRTSGPLQTWTDAFKPHNYIVLEEPFAGGWQPWQCVFPPNGCTPGTVKQSLPPETLADIVHWLHIHWKSAPPGLRIPPGGVTPPTPPTPPIPPCVPVARPPREVGCIGTVTKGPTPPTDPRDHVAKLLEQADCIANQNNGGPPSPQQANWIVQLIQDAMNCAWTFLQKNVATDFPTFQLWVAINLGGSTVCGIINDNLLSVPWDTIDNLDLRAWLAKNGANDVTVNSSPVRAVYDLAFAYAKGDPTNGQFAAGTAMSGMLRMVLMYKGSIFYKMQAGMGDTVFTPLYTVLANRGVKFEFFHKVEALHVDATNTMVSSIDLTVQARPKKTPEDPEGKVYNPLFDVLGLPCWPSEPLYERIEHGEELAGSGVNFESAWSPPWKYSTPKTLTSGADFDVVVLGISIGSFPYIARELSLAQPATFGAMVTNVKTVETCAFQLWMAPDLAGLGWVDPSGTQERPVLGAFVEPIDTWADMSQLLVRETWPSPAPNSVAYFCGPLKDSTDPQPFGDYGYPARELGKFQGRAITFLENEIYSLWPSVATKGEFHWDTLVDLGGQHGSGRFASQYSRVNLDPSERYVLSVPGSTQYRLAANGSGFTNVILAGDWTQCEINAGCVEAAATSGMLAAQAIAGTTRQIAWVPEAKGK